MERRACHDFEKAPGHDHSTIRVADVLVRLEQRPTVLAQQLDAELQRTATPGVGQEQVRVDAVRVREEIADSDPLGCSWGRQFELWQVRDDPFIEIDGGALDLLEHERRGQDFCDRSKQDAGVIEHRRPGDDIRQAVGDDELLASVINPG
jgi:hypothetical protein